MVHLRLLLEKASFVVHENAALLRVFQVPAHASLHKWKVKKHPKGSQRGLKSKPAFNQHFASYSEIKARHSRTLLLYGS